MGHSENLDSATGTPLTSTSRERQTPCFGLMTINCCVEMGTCRALRDRGHECAYGPSRSELLDFLRYHPAGLSQGQEDLSSNGLQHITGCLAEEASLGSDQCPLWEGQGMRWKDPEDVLQRLKDAWCKRFSFETSARPGNMEPVFRGPLSKYKLLFHCLPPHLRGMDTSQGGPKQAKPRELIQETAEFRLIPWTVDIQMSQLRLPHEVATSE